MHLLRQCRGLLGRLPSIQSLHCSACQASSNLEKFIAGTYDPVAEAKKREDEAKRGRGDGREGGQQQGGRFNQQQVGQEARRQALGSLRAQLLHLRAVILTYSRHTMPFTAFRRCLSCAGYFFSVVPVNLLLSVTHIAML
jgi:hypothetical protein